jgi:aspartokinase
MQTTTDSVRQIVRSQPLIEQALKDDIINLSQYAKQIQPLVEAKNMKKTQIGAIITALSRVRSEVTTSFNIDFKINDISLKYPLTEISYQNAPDHVQKTGELYSLFSQKQNHFLNIIAGNTETTIFVNSKYEADILKAFKPYKPVKIIPNLAGISLKFSDQYFEVPGITYEVLKTLVWNKINLAEIISTYTEITLIISKKDSQRTFELLSDQFVG